MGYFSEKHEESYNQFNGTHQGHVTHDLLGGAVAFEAAKAWEDHCAANGKPGSHALAKELIAGFVGAAATRLVETKGLNTWDEYKRKQAEKKASEHLEETIVVNEYKN